MSAIRRLSIPLAVLLLVGLPVFWAWPAGLPPARGAGIVLGWLGCGLLLSSLLLMLREVRLAHCFGGLQRMYAWHHVLGTLAYLALLAHPLALAAAAWPTMAWATLSPWQEQAPIWLGWLALLCLMAGLAATFARRLSYPLWRGLHGLLALAVLLGLGHLLLLGLSQALLFSLTLALLFLLWRLLRTDYGLAARPYLVDQVEHVASGVVEVTLRPLALPLAARPGQFAFFTFLEGAGFRGCRESHPFTISAVEPAGRLRIGVKALGDCSCHLQAVAPGVAVRVHGPFGDFLRERPNGPQLWLAGGIGITPFLAALRGEPLSQPTRLHYFYRTPSDAAYGEELHALAARQPLLELHLHAGQPTAPELAALLPAAAGLAGCQCYLCGPPGLLASAIDILTSRGVLRTAIHFEHFDFR